MSIKRLIPRLILVTDRHRARMSLPALAVRAAVGGVDAIQIREKDLSDDEYERLVHSVVEAAPSQMRVVVNSRPEIAARCGADIHFSENMFQVIDDVFRDARLTSRSLHSPVPDEQGPAVDYLLAGHLFPTSSKSGSPPLGAKSFRRIVASAAVPVLAIGGITAANVDQAFQAGAYGVAVVSAINDAEHPELAARAIRISLEEAMTKQRDTTAPDITVSVNGASVQVPTGTTVQQFLESRNLRDRLVVVEINKSIVARATFPTRVLESGDGVEIVHFVGGG